VWQQLAAKEDKSKSEIDRRLRFGRFLNFPPMGGMGIPKNLTERRFRGYWDRTDSKMTDEERFDQVAQMVKEAVTLQGDRSSMKYRELAAAIIDLVSSPTPQTTSPTLGRIGLCDPSLYNTRLMVDCARETDT
jgi:hypothetical protein